MNYILKYQSSISIKKCCLFFLFFLNISNAVQSQTINEHALKVIIIRHAEKPKIGDNLNCRGLNRSQLLPAVIVSKFDIPSYTYVPSVGADSVTKHARMFQTVIPLAVKYNLTINSKFIGKDSSGIVNDILKKSGTVLIVWDHKSIVPIIHAFGINGSFLKWDESDFDSIWIITFKDKKTVLTIDKEGLMPAEDCK